RKGRLYWRSKRKGVPSGWIRSVTELFDGMAADRSCGTRVAGDDHRKAVRTVRVLQCQMSNVQRRMSNGLVKRPTNQTIGSLGGLVKFIRHSTLDTRHWTPSEQAVQKTPEAHTIGLGLSTMQRGSAKLAVLFLIAALTTAACKGTAQPSGPHLFQRTYASMGTE